MRIIYYKQGKLNIPKTVWSLAKYSMKQRLNGRRPAKLIISTSVE